MKHNWAIENEGHPDGICTCCLKDATIVKTKGQYAKRPIYWCADCWKNMSESTIGYFDFVIRNNYHRSVSNYTPKPYHRTFDQWADDLYVEVK